MYRDANAKDVSRYIKSLTPGQRVFVQEKAAKCPCGAVLLKEDMVPCETRNGVPVMLCRKCFLNKGKLRTAYLVVKYKVSRDLVASITATYNSSFSRAINNTKVFREHTIDVEYLVKQWLAQDAKCAVTGLPMEFIAGVGRRLHASSLDRIDNKAGYEPGNVQWICLGVNTMKGWMTMDQVRYWSRAVVKGSKKAAIDTAASDGVAKNEAGEATQG